MASARVTVERGVVGFGLDYACAHIIIPVSLNLLPIQANFVTERIMQQIQENLYSQCSSKPHSIGSWLLCCT